MNSVNTQKSPQPGQPAAPTVHDRLVQLERLVLTMMPHSPPASSAYPDMLDPGPTPPKQETLGKAVDEGSECRSLQVGSLEHRYVGGAHWAAILDGIADLKNHFDRDEHIMSIATGSDHDVGISGPRPRSPHALLLYGCREPAPRSEILAALPPRGIVGRFVSRYFNMLDLAPCKLLCSTHPFPVLLE